MDVVTQGLFQTIALDGELRLGAFKRFGGLQAPAERLDLRFGAPQFFTHGGVLLQSSA